MNLRLRLLIIRVLVVTDQETRGILFGKTEYSIYTRSKISYRAVQ